MNDCTRFVSELRTAQERFTLHLERSVSPGVMREAILKNFNDAVRSSYMLGIADMREVQRCTMDAAAENAIASRATLTY